MTEAELQAMDDPNEPNLPQRLPGHQGSMATVPIAEQRARRAAMTSLLSQGVGTDDIIGAFEAKFGMTESATRTLIAEVRAMWDDDDVEAARYARGAARRRIHRHITEASKDRKWTAVANLEKVLSDVEGTSLKEEETPVDIDSRLTEAMLHMLGVSDTSEVRIMIERERAIIELGPEDDRVKKLSAKTAKATVIDAARG